MALILQRRLLRELQQAEAEEGGMGTLIHNDLWYLELGRRFPYPLSLTPAPTNALLRQVSNANKHESVEIQQERFGALFPEKKKRMQATVRDIRIVSQHQCKGLFTTLVKYLLERDGSVHLECVMNAHLKVRLAASPLWVRQSVENTDNPKEQMNPSYARFVLNEPFTLF